MAELFSVNIDPSNLLRRLDNGEKRQAYAISNAINSTLKLIQQAEREEVDQRLTVRKTDFIHRKIAKINPFASPSQGRPFGEVFIDTKVSGSPLFLPTLETGGLREPVVGRGSAVPITGGPARPTFSQNVPTPFRFRGLGLTAHFTKGRAQNALRRAAAAAYERGGQLQFKGRRRTFEILKGEHPGVYQRVGKGDGADALELVYAFRDEVQLKEMIDFVATARGITDRWFARFLELEIEETLARRGAA